MDKRIIISKENSAKALAFFEELNKRKEEAKIRIEERTKGMRERLMKEHMRQ